MNKGLPETKNENPVRVFYDAVASEYAERYFHEFDSKPFDRWILTRFADFMRPRGLVADMGCGPGEVARFLKDLGVDVIGVDLSSRMLGEARRLNPDIEFLQGDILKLDLRDAHLEGIAAFYAIVHFTMDQVQRAVVEFHRVLASGGMLLMCFHIGNERILIEEAFGKSVSVEFAFFDPDEVLAVLKAEGFEIQETVIRYPYPEVEYPSKRAYVLALKSKKSNAPMSGKSQP